METETTNPNKKELETYLKVISFFKRKCEVKKLEVTRTVKSPYVRNFERAHAGGRLYEICDTLDMFGYYETKIKKNLAN